MLDKSKRHIADLLFRFFTNDFVLGAAIIISTFFIFLNGDKVDVTIYVFIDAFFTLFFLAEALVKIFCISPGPGRNTLKEKFKYYWFGKYDIEKQRSEIVVESDDDDDEQKIEAYRKRKHDKEKEKEKKEKGFLRKYVFFFLFDGDEETSHWNQFDFIITLLALPSLLNFFPNVLIPTNLFISLRTLRMFRTLRIAKAARIMRFIPDIDKLLRGIKSALKSCLVVVIGFIIFMLFTSILSSTLFGEFAPEYFGSPGQALYSTFRLFTIEGWFDIPDAIAQRSTPGMGIFAKIYFSFFLFAGGILGVSLINSFFVDAMAEDNNEDVLAKLEEMEKMIKDLQEQKKQETDENEVNN